MIDYINNSSETPPYVPYMSKDYEYAYGDFDDCQSGDEIKKEAGGGWHDADLLMYGLCLTGIHWYRRLKVQEETILPTCPFTDDMLGDTTEINTWLPEYGDKIIVWDDNDSEEYARVFIAKTKGYIYCVDCGDEMAFKQGFPFSAIKWDNMREIEESDESKTLTELQDEVQELRRQLDIIHGE